jgi:hypothetical protein
MPRVRIAETQRHPAPGTLGRRSAELEGILRVVRLPDEAWQIREMDCAAKWFPEASAFRGINLSGLLSLISLGADLASGHNLEELVNRFSKTLVANLLTIHTRNDEINLRCRTMWQRSHCF